MSANPLHRHGPMDEKEKARIRKQFAAKVPKKMILKHHRISREVLEAIVREKK